MRKHKWMILFLALVVALIPVGASAASVDLDGTVVGVDAVRVIAPIGGTVEEVPVMAGQLVEAGEGLVQLKTTKVYASESGTVTGIFAQVGDNLEVVSEKYGAALVIEPDSKYQIVASTDNSYSAQENKYVHVGEKVYLKCTSDGAHKGEGTVISVVGTDFTVEVTSGDFYMGETISVFREEDYASSTRIGRGDIERCTNLSVTGTGSLVALHVSDGERVERGDLLFETLEGEFDAYYSTGTLLTTNTSGILAELNVSEGGQVAKGDAIASIYPRENLRIAVALQEANLSALSVGDTVSISFNWNEDGENSDCVGTVTEILYTASEGEDVTYTAYVDFEAGEEIRLGMGCVVYTLEDAVEEEVDEAQSE